MHEIEFELRGLMRNAQRGDAAAYARLLTALVPRLRAFFRRRLARDPESVEDLVQETLLALHNQRHTYAGEQPFTPWLYAIAKYKLIDFLRRRAGSVEEPLDDEEASAVLDESTTEAFSAQRDVARLLAALPPHFRLPIEHVKLEGLSVQEASVKTGMSVAAIKVGIHRGMKALARNLLAVRDALG